MSKYNRIYVDTSREEHAVAAKFFEPVNGWSGIISPLSESTSPEPTFAVVACKGYETTWSDGIVVRMGPNESNSRLAHKLVDLLCPYYSFSVIKDPFLLADHYSIELPYKWFYDAKEDSMLPYAYVMNALVVSIYNIILVTE